MKKSIFPRFLFSDFIVNEMRENEANFFLYFMGSQSNNPQNIELKTIRTALELPDLGR